MNLSQVSRTAITTLIGRVVESERKNTIFNDPMAVLCLERLTSIASAEEKNWILRQKRLFAALQAHHAKPVALRARAFDSSANLFIANNPKCTVINLACGFDTRFWRIKKEGCRYVEIDLPEVIALKRDILKGQIDYELIGCSVLDASWINQATAKGNSRFLLLAEGLFMFLPKSDATTLLQRLGQRLDRSQLVLDMVHERYTRGIWKKLIAMETRYWRSDISYVFGIKNPREIESFARGLKVLGVVKGVAGPIITVAINGA
jgi:methyltransferase (TIGR00027 family)